MMYVCNRHKPLMICMFFLSQMILFSSCCICGLIGGILNFQFVRALVKRPDTMRSLHLAVMSLACLGISSCTLSTWLTCRLASSEQQRMFLEREHSLHHSHEMAEKVRQELVCLCCLCVPVDLARLQSTFSYKCFLNTRFWSYCEWFQSYVGHMCYFFFYCGFEFLYDFLETKRTLM